MNRRNKITIIFSFCALALLSVRSASAQSLDIIGPSIVYRPSTVSTHVGQALQVQAVITDNEAIKEAVLFYRPTGKEGYLSLAMTLQAGKNNLYSAAIPQEFVIEPRMEFYIQATDTSGNTTSQGSSSFPLQVTVFPPQLQEPERMPPKTAEIPKTEPPKISETGPLQTTKVPAVTEPLKIEKQEGTLPAITMQPPTEAKPKPSVAVKPFYKKAWFWSAVALVSGAVVASQGKDNDASTNTGSITFTVPAP